MAELTPSGRTPAACTECRGHKIRCYPPGPNETCERCVRMSLDCIYQKHRRGRKRKDGSAPGDPSKRPMVRMASPHVAETVDIIPNQEYEESSDEYEMAQFPFMGSVSRAPPTTSLRRMIETPRASPGPSRRLSSTRKSLSPIRAMSRVRGASSLTGDPVSAGMLAETEAKTLYDLYMQHCNQALPLIDPKEDTYEHIRSTSSFLFTAILCVASRYVNTEWCHSPYRPITSLAPESPHSVHQQILVMSRDHMTWAFAEAACSIDVLQAMCLLFLYKEPDDDKAGFYFSRAVLMAQELGLGRMYSMAQLDRMSAEEKKMIRMKQRIWFNVFIANSIFHMQFDQRLLIDDTDPLINTATNWLQSSTDILSDTRLIFSVELRKKYTIYRQLLQLPYSSSASCPLALSLTARRINADWDITVHSWEQRIQRAGATPHQLAKTRVWSTGLKLGLNLVVIHQTRLAHARETVTSDPAMTVVSYHHAVLAATKLLDGIHTLAPAQITFATDTLLHFYIYAASFLWTTCHRHQSEAEPAYVSRLITSAAEVLAKASAYPSDSPAMHSRYLQRLVRRREQPGRASETDPKVTALVVQNDPVLFDPSAFQFPDLDPVMSGWTTQNDLNLDDPLELSWPELDPVWNMMDTAQWSM